MSRQKNVYKQAYNGALRLLGDGDGLPSEPELSARLGVSRTTVRSILAHMKERGLIDWDKRQKRALRVPTPRDFYPSDETDSTSAIVERNLLRRLVQGDLEAGTPMSESDLARQLGVATTTVREFLIRFSRFGLIEKRRNSHWVIKGFTRDFAKELADIRELFELRSALAFVKLPGSSPLWADLDAIEAQHLDLRQGIAERYAEFSALDEQFHRLVHRATQNRFIADFYDIIAIVFHYHYQWNKSDERERNAAALEEHLRYIAALRSRKVSLARQACLRHLASARATLLASIAKPVGAGEAP